MVISNGCKYLSLNSDQIEADLKLNRLSSLIYLKLVTIIPILPTDVHFNDSLSEEILKSCEFLKKLSINGYISPNMATYFGPMNGKELEVLELRWCTFINEKSMRISGYASEKEEKNELNSVELIVKNCTNLKEFCFDGTRISDKALDFLVNNLAPTVEVLSLNFNKGSLFLVIISDWLLNK